MKNTQELPKWFTNSGGVCYNKGDKVTNFLSNNSINLTNTELSMYCLLYTSDAADEEDSVDLV